MLLRELFAENYGVFFLDTVYFTFFVTFSLLWCILHLTYFIYTSVLHLILLFYF